jgi:hypothetical protein
MSFFTSEFVSSATQSADAPGVALMGVQIGTCMDGAYGDQSGLDYVPEQPDPTSLASTTTGTDVAPLAPSAAERLKAMVLRF